MLNKISTALTLLISITLSSGVYADNDIQWYDVELIFFRQLSSTGIDNETWDPQLLQPDTAECVDIGFGRQLDTSEEITDEEQTVEEILEDETEETAKQKTAIPFIALSSAQLQLKKEAAAIARSKGQRLLAHIGWRQPGYDQNNAIPVRINAGPLLLAKPLVQEELQEDNFQVEPTKIASNSLYANSTVSETTEEKKELQSQADESAKQSATITPLTDSQQVIDIEIREVEETPEQQAIATTKLNGCITIFRERYLHILTDLIYYHEDNEDIYADEEEESYSFGKQVYATAVPLKTRRRMRSREIHYLDSPGVGVVVLVTPYDFPNESEGN